MSSRLTESVVEDAALDWLGESIQQDRRRACL